MLIEKEMSYRWGAQFYDLFDTKGNIDFYLSIVKNTRGTVLELGMGTGRVLFEIAKLGRNVVGIDNSPHMLAEAKKKLETTHRDLKTQCRLIQADMRSIKFRKSFGFIYSASSGLNLPRVDDISQVFQTVADHLKLGGIFAFDLISPSSLRKTYFGFVGRKRLRDGKIVIRYISQNYEKDADVTSLDIFYEIFDSEGKMIDKFHEFGEMAVITPEMIGEMLRDVNLRVKSFWGDFKGNPYKTNSNWLVIIAEKCSLC